MARPVLATSGAATGTGAEAGRHLLVADGDRGLIAEALKLLAAPERGQVLGRAARDFVLQHRSWAAALFELPRYIGFDRSLRDAA